MPDFESPESYGEIFTSTQALANTWGLEQEGESDKQYLPDIWGDNELRALVPSDFRQKWDAMVASPVPALAGVIRSTIAAGGAKIQSGFLDSALRKFNYLSAEKFPDMRMGSATASQLARRNRVSQEFMRARFLSESFASEEADLVYQNSAPQIAMPDWFRWARYHGNPENTWSTLREYLDIDPIDFPVWDWLGQSQFTLDHLTNLFNRGVMSQSWRRGEMERLGWSEDKHDLLEELSWTIPNAMILMQGDLMADKSDKIIMSDLGHADLHPDYRQKYYDAVRTKPATFDLVAYHLRQDNNLRELDTDLRRLGIHPDYYDVYHTLAQQIPPIPDLITMAVREAFSPDVARRFGQFEDFPEPFADYARQRGLTEDWAKRYWAAHWNLPSPQQGFAMLHRGVITEDDLQLLLRSQDVMPFWREKLTQIAYRPLTRVDVRRMYKEGVLTETEVLESYLDQGYNEQNAERMTEFTVRQTLSSLARFTSTDILKAYTTGVIKESEASSLLREIGIKTDDVRTILQYAEYKRDWDYTNDRIAAIGNLYRKHELDDNQTRAELGRLNLPSDQVNVLLDRWFTAEKEKAPMTWTKAETLKFITAKTITRERGVTELERIGYDQEHITAYLTPLE